MTEMIRHFVDGSFVDGTPERTGPVYDPATGEGTKRVAFAGPSEVDPAQLDLAEELLLDAAAWAGDKAVEEA